MPEDRNLERICCNGNEAESMSNPSEDRILAVFGATGTTGLALVAEARRRGWQVRALVRGAAGTLEGQVGVEIVRGEFSNLERVQAVIEGTQAVCCVFGPRPPFSEIFCVEATQAVIEAMRRSGVRRLIVQTGAMVGQNLPNWTFAWRIMISMYQRQQARGAQDRIEQERLVRQSALDWTIIKPPRLTDGVASRHVRAGSDLRVGLLSSISRADLTAFLMDEVEHPRFVGQAVFVTGS
jgi:putative NADH-flavin reductase